MNQMPRRDFRVGYGLSVTSNAELPTLIIPGRSAQDSSTASAICFTCKMMNPPSSLNSKTVSGAGGGIAIKSLDWTRQLLPSAILTVKVRTVMPRAIL